MDVTAYIGIAFYYLFFLVGSITIGYFVLRVSYSEVRTYDQQKKLVVSGMLGLIIVFLSYITNIFFFGVDRFLNIDSYIEIFTIIYATLFFIVFKYYYSYTPKYMTIAVPIKEEKPKPQKQEEKKKTVTPTKIQKTPTLQELKEEITGRDIEINIPLKTNEIQQEGIEGVKREILGESFQNIQVPLKQSIEVPLKQEQSQPVKQPEKPKPAAIQKTQPAPAKTEEAKQVKGIEKPKPQTTTQKEIPAKKEEKPESEFKFQKTEKPQEQKQEGGFKFQKKQEKPKTIEETEIEGIIKDVVKETVEEAQGKEIPKHRRYLLTPEQKEKVKVIASSDMAGKEEFQSLVQDVYEELRKTKTEGNVQKITPNVPSEPAKKEEKKEEKPKPEEKKEEKRERRRDKEVKEEKPVQTLSINDVLGGEGGLETKKQEQQPTGLFAQLSGITESTTPTEAQKEQKSSEFVKIESESGMGCPNCHAKNTRIVFCPYCGGAMCTNCSPQIKIEGDHFIFTCPHCGEEVTVKKKK